MNGNNDFRGRVGSDAPAPEQAVPVDDRAKGHAPASVPDAGKAFTLPMAAPSRFRIDYSAGVWTVVKGGRFSGDYFKEAHAKAAVATALCS